MLFWLRMKDFDCFLKFEKGVDIFMFLVRLDILLNVVLIDILLFLIFVFVIFEKFLIFILWFKEIEIILYFLIGVMIVVVVDMVFLLLNDELI